ncbi:hypothetical protein AJ78_02120 [Emergomyces pasteurianus Ep9510]|uniref:Uncharacterized protein n=1 Tax=Emergomyces pasteurianus Ep9510 TaxID=1447872 RepID=A0A1J9QRD2_9EURO|nr:hypothetical protein AJ78_02120 [Emergomyces pasteurianus Ep9510]
MPRGRKRDVAPAAPPSTAISQGKSKRIRLGAGSGTKGRINTRSSRGEREESSEYAGDIYQSADAGVNEDVNPGASEDDDDDTDNEDDYGDKEAELTREALRDLQAALERTEKRDDNAKEFEKIIGEDEKRLLGLVEAGIKESEFESERFRSRIIHLIGTALAPTGAKAPAAGSAGDAQKLGLGDVLSDRHPLYIRSQALLQCTRSLVQEYDNLAAYICSLEAPPDLVDMWERDCAETRRVIAIGVEASQAEIDRLLARKDDARKRDAKEKTASKGKKERGIGRAKVFAKDELLQTMLKMGKEKDSTFQKREPYGWGKMAHQVVKGMKALVKALPDERNG